MIPALLSCVFVIYLYRSLNHSPSNAAAAETGNHPTDSAVSTDSLTDLSRRTSALEDRLLRLAAEHAPQEKAP